jgi:hypothetical protein
MIRKLKIKAKKRNRFVWFGDYVYYSYAFPAGHIQQRYSTPKRKRGKR